MMYGTLTDLMYFMFGHGNAYRELGLIERDDAFALQFCDWIYKTYGVSASAGWAKACESVSNSKSSPVAIFEKWVLEFLERWIDTTTT
jgi:hypothetical protein